MATGKTFKNDVRIMTDDEINKYHEALNTLRNWDLFEREFGYGSGLAVLRSIVSEEQTRRILSDSL